jgi:hypothetical protein
MQWTSSQKTVATKMRVLWQNLCEEVIADEEVEVQGRTDYLPLAPGGAHVG